jgi:hypothetical protein
LLAVQAATGKKPPELTVVEFPDEFAYLIEWFSQIKQPLTYSEIYHWSLMTRRSLDRWELDVLIKLDAIRCSNTPS